MKKKNYPALAVRSRWMVVDDEPELVSALTESLGSLGLASVEGFITPAEALAEFETRDGGFQVVVTDRDMPGMNGIELARRLRAVRRDVKIVLITAHTEGLRPSELRQAGIDAVVAKPFRFAELEAAVRAPLGLAQAA